MGGLLGMQNFNADEMTSKLEEMLPVIREVNEQFRDPVSCALSNSGLTIHDFYRAMHQIC